MGPTASSLVVTSTRVRKQREPAASEAGPPAAFGAPCWSFWLRRQVSPGLPTAWPDVPVCTKRASGLQEPRLMEEVLRVWPREPTTREMLCPVRSSSTCPPFCPHTHPPPYPMIPVRGICQREQRVPMLHPSLLVWSSLSKSARMEKQAYVKMLRSMK